MANEEKKKIELKEISQSKRNSALFHMGIPYFMGRNVRRILVEIGGDSVEAGRRAHKAAYTIGELVSDKARIIEIVIKKHKQ